MPTSENQVVIYAIVCTDPSTTIEDVVVGQMGGVAIPMVGPNPDMLIEAGQNMARGTGLVMRLVKFTQDEEIQVFSPDIEVPDDVEGIEPPDDRVRDAEFMANPPDEDMQYPRSTEF